VVTTVTTTTVTTITSAAATAAATGLITTLGIVAVSSLVIFLATKELAAARSSGFSMRIARFAGVGIWPLAIVLGILASIKVTEILL